MILEKLNSLVNSINRNFTEALYRHKIQLPPVFQMFEHAVVSSEIPLGSVEYHMVLRDMFHQEILVSSVYSVYPNIIKDNAKHAVEVLQERFYTELTKYMMFTRTTTYTNDMGIEVNFRSMADILEDILKQHNDGGFRDVDPEWLHSRELGFGVNRINESKKRLNG